MRASFVALFAFLVVGFVAGCATPSSGRVYPRNEARTAWDVVDGRVVGVSAVQIEGQTTWLGTAGGGFVGDELGRSVGHGHGSDIAGAVGGLAGAVVGQAAEERLTRQNGLQIEVELDRGERIAIVQAADVAFTPGERVKVLRRRDGAARVTKI